MSLSEFELIQTYFNRIDKVNDPDILLGIGDDCAIIHPQSGKDLLLSVDTLIEGVHFPIGTSAEYVGWRSLAVNLSDLAAMGAKPAWFTLALTLPNNNEAWIKAFSIGLFNLADQHEIKLIGGDTTKGTLSITIQVHGYVPTGESLRRDKAVPDDYIYVTGFLGDAGSGLRHITKNNELNTDYLVARFQQPQPRLSFGQAIRAYANSAIDISDGLLADLSHILEKSKVGACINIDDIPCSPQLIAIEGKNEALNLALTAGDDYELCFTASSDNHEQIMRCATQHQLLVTRIGTITSECLLKLNDANGNPVVVSSHGYQHF